MGRGWASCELCGSRSGGGIACFDACYRGARGIEGARGPASHLAAGKDSLSQATGLDAPSLEVRYLLEGCGGAGATGIGVYGG
jgi:hypothetical protein